MVTILIHYIYYKMFPERIALMRATNYRITPKFFKISNKITLILDLIIVACIIIKITRSVFI